MRRYQSCLVAVTLPLLCTGIALAQVDQPPSINSPVSLQAAEGIGLELLVSAMDPDGDPIQSLTASPLPPGATFTTSAGNTSGTFSWQPTYQQAGSYSIVFTAVNAMTGTATTIIDVADTRTQANDPYAARLWFGASAATGEISFALPPNPILGGPNEGLDFTIYYASLLERTARYQGALGVNWRGTYDWRLFVSGATAEVEDHLGARYRFVAGSAGDWVLSEPTALPHALVAFGSELVFKHGESLCLYFFDPSSGRLTRLQDLPGNELTLTYLSGALAQVSDAFGRTLTFTHDRDGHVSQVSDGTRAATFAYVGNLLRSHTDTAGGTTIFAYDATNPIPGLITSVEDPTGAVPIQYQYDSFGRVIAAINAGSASFGLSYVAAGETEVTSSEGGLNSFTHRLPGRLTRHVDAMGGVTTWTYDAQGRVTDVSRPGGAALLHTDYDPVSSYPSAITYPGGAQFQFTYVAKSRVPGVVWYRLAVRTAPDLTRIQLTYDAAGNLARVVDEALHSWLFIRNAQGQPTQVTNPSGGVTTYGYDSFGRLASRTVGSSVTTYAYDALDRLITITQPDLSSRGFTYDGMNRCLTSTNELAKTWTFTYRPNGQLSSVLDPLLHPISFGYDPMNLLTSATDALGHAELYGYDALGRLTSRTDRTGRTWTYSYDLLGRLATSADPDLNVTVRGWDTKSRLEFITGPLSRTTSYTYDARDRLSSVTDPLGEVTSFTYNDRDHLTRISAPLGYTEAYGYDARGLLESVQIGPTSAQFAHSPLRRLTTYTDGNGEDWLRAYDNRGRLTSQTDPLSRTETFTYDSRDRLSGFSSTLGTASLTWDAVSRLTQRSYSDGTVHNYAYDDVGRLLTTEGIARTYDALGRLTQENSISFGYDNASRLTSQSFGTGLTVAHTYDTRGLPGQVSDWTGRTTQFQYDAAGRRTRLVRSNGNTTDYEYDAADRLTHWSVTNAESIASGTTSHDKLGRVKVQSHWNSAVNVTPPITAGVYSHDAASQIVGFTYDNMGRLLNDGVRTYTWDLASRLTSFTEGGKTKTVRYDGLDRAYESTLDGVVTGYEFGRGFAGALRPGLPNGPAPQGGNSSGHEVGHWHGLYHGTGSTGGAAGHEVGHWQGLYHTSSPTSSTPLYFPGKLKVNGNPMLYTVSDQLLYTIGHLNASTARAVGDQLLYTIGHLNGEAIHHHVDDLANVSFLTNDVGSITTNYSYSPTGEPSRHGSIPPFLRYSFRASAAALEESQTGLYRIGTGLYDTKTGRTLPDRLKIAPPSTYAQNRLYVGNLSFDTSASGTDGAILVVSALDGPVSRPGERVPIGQQSGGDADHPDFLWSPTRISFRAFEASLGGSIAGRGSPYHPTARYAVQVGWWENATTDKYYLTGARHVYMPSGEGFRTNFTLGTAAPPNPVVPAPYFGSASDFDFLGWESGY